MNRVMAMVTPERLVGITLGLGLAGVILTSWLVISGLFREPTCPTLLGIPACFILLGAYVAAVAGAWLSGSRAGDGLFLGGAGMVTLIGAWFSVNQLLGQVECPTLEGLPMCYVSLLAGASMLTADLLRRRL